MKAGELLVKLDGALDWGTVPEIRKKLLKVSRRKGIKILVADFSRVSDMDTAGVAMLLEVMRALSRKDGQLQLAGLSENIQQIIRLARLDQVFQIRDDSDGKSVQ